MKDIIDHGKKGNLFIHKKDEKYKTPPDAVSDLYVLYLLFGNTCYTQATEM